MVVKVNGCHLRSVPAHFIQTYARYVKEHEAKSGGSSSCLLEGRCVYFEIVNGSVGFYAPVDCCITFWVPSHPMPRRGSGLSMHPALTFIHAPSVLSLTRGPLSNITIDLEFFFTYANLLTWPLAVLVFRNIG